MDEKKDWTKYLMENEAWLLTEESIKDEDWVHWGLNDTDG
jgi:hypothetical protein